MTIRKIAEINFITHSVLVSQDTFTQRIYLFKHTDRLCDYASFESAEAATDYILTPFPNIQYTLHVAGDDPAQYS